MEFVLSINFLQHVNQICLIQIIKIRILSQKITKNIFAEKLTHPVNIMCATEKSCMFKKLYYICLNALGMKGLLLCSYWQIIFVNHSFFDNMLPAFRQP